MLGLIIQELKNMIKSPQSVNKKGNKLYGLIKKQELPDEKDLTTIETNKIFLIDK